MPQGRRGEGYMSQKIGRQGKRQQRWHEKRTPARLKGLPSIAFLGQEGEQKAEGGKEQLRSVIEGGNTPHTSPSITPLPLPHPSVPLVSINETAFSFRKETAILAVAGPETPHHQRILKGSCKGSLFSCFSCHHPLHPP